MIYFTKSVDRDTPLHLAGDMIAVSSILQNRNKLGQIQSNLQLADTLSSGHLQLPDIYRSSQTTRNCMPLFYSSIQRTPLYSGRGHFFTMQTRKITSKYRTVNSSLS